MSRVSLKNGAIGLAAIQNNAGDIMAIESQGQMVTATLWIGESQMSVDFKRDGKTVTWVYRPI